MVQLNICCVGNKNTRHFFSCIFKINIIFSLILTTGYIKSSMRLIKDFGSKQCTHGLTRRFNMFYWQ